MVGIAAVPKSVVRWEMLVRGFRAWRAQWARGDAVFEVVRQPGDEVGAAAALDAVGHSERDVGVEHRPSASPRRCAIGCCTPPSDWSSTPAARACACSAAGPGPRAGRRLHPPARAATVRALTRAHASYHDQRTQPGAAA